MTAAGVVAAEAVSFTGRALSRGGSDGEIPSLASPRPAAPPARATSPEAAPFRLAGRRVWVAGHRGMVGAALMRRLAGTGSELLTVTRAECDLRDQAAVTGWMAQARPEVVILAAATVGGIAANAARPATFLYDNLAIATNVIEGARQAGVAKLLFLGSSCIYPRAAPQPIPEEALLTGPLEPTNEAYAIAKIAGLKLCAAYRQEHGCDFISVQPTNLYGPGDNYDPEGSHVLPALLRRFHKARLARAPEVAVWGSGAPLREFLHVDDLADALVFLLERYSGMVPVNVGSGQEVSIAALARMVADVTGYAGRITFDPARPDGTPRKRLDCSRLHALGWDRARPLAQGLAETYADWCAAGNSSGRPGRRA
ncbi:GDP-L-fucose synthase family protein [Halodurantibacterium flavum]|uniref:GDP-L-fucose synthase n=1 Tax=Halodurantibacterium flavum TaxID=1382802 RepID=A0ABW4S5Q8_9RHOB